MNRRGLVSGPTSRPSLAKPCASAVASGQNTRTWCPRCSSLGVMLATCRPMPPVLPVSSCATFMTNPPQPMAYDGGEPTSGTRPMVQGV